MVLLFAPFTNMSQCPIAMVVIRTLKRVNPWHLHNIRRRRQLKQRYFHFIILESLLNYFSFICAFKQVKKLWKSRKKGSKVKSIKISHNWFCNLFFYNLSISATFLLDWTHRLINSILGCGFFKWNGFRVFHHQRRPCWEISKTHHPARGNALQCHFFVQG